MNLHLQAHLSCELSVVLAFAFALQPFSSGTGVGTPSYIYKHLIQHNLKKLAPCQTWLKLDNVFKIIVVRMRNSYAYKYKNIHVHR